jgi:hypothetical protein
MACPVDVAFGNMRLFAVAFIFLAIRHADEGGNGVLKTFVTILCLA